MQGDIKFKIHNYTIMQNPILKKIDPPPLSPRQKFRSSGVFQGIESFWVPKCKGISS